MKADLQLALLAEAKRLGKKPEDLTSAEVTAVAVAMRTLKEVIWDGAKAVESLAATSTGFRKVPLTIYHERKGEKGCGGCKLMGTTPKGQIYCKQCGCAGVLMESALNDPNQSCRLPAGQKRWEKYVEPS